jgi:hypothetical protein
VELDWIPRHSTNYSNKIEHSEIWLDNPLRATDEDWYHGYEMENQQSRLMARITWYTIILSGSTVGGNLFFIFIDQWNSNIHLWNQTLGSIKLNTFIIHYIRLFFHILHGKCSELQPTLHDFLWFLISSCPLLSSSCNTTEGKQLQNIASI